MNSPICRHLPFNSFSSSSSILYRYAYRHVVASNIRIAQVRRAHELAGEEQDHVLVQQLADVGCLRRIGRHRDR